MISLQSALKVIIDVKLEVTYQKIPSLFTLNVTRDLREQKLITLRI